LFLPQLGRIGAFLISLACAPSLVIAATVDIVLPIRSDDVILGDVGVRVSKETSDFEIDPNSLKKTLAKIATPEALQSIPEESIDYISADRLRALGIDLKLDLRSAEITANLLGPQKLPQTIRVTPKRGQPSISEDAIEPAIYSAYLNAELELISNLGDDIVEQEDSALNLDGALYLGPIFDVTIAGSAELRADGQFEREATTAIIEDPEGEWILRIGDHTISGIGLIQSQNFFGVDFTNQLPGSLKRNTLGGNELQIPTLTIDEPSTARIFVNDIERRTLRLGPGTYDLTGVPLSAGDNDIRLEIERADGTLNVIELSEFFDASLPDKGELKYGVSAGIATQNDDEVDFEDQVVASGFVKYGVSNSLSLGAAVQLSEVASVASGSVLWGSSLGKVSAHLAISNNGASEASVAGGARYQRNIPLPKAVPAIANLDVDFEFEEADFQNDILDSLSRDDNQMRFSSRLVLSFDNGWRTRASYRRLAGEQESDRFALNVGKRFDNWSLSAGIFHDKFEFTDETSAFVALSVDLGERSDASIRYDTDDNEIAARFSRHSEYGGVGAWNYSFGTSFSEDGTIRPIGSGRFTGNRFQASGSATRDRVVGRLGSSFAFADGEFAVGAPIRDRFILINPSELPDEKRLRVGREPLEAENYAAGSDSFLDVTVLPINGGRTRTRTLWFDTIDLESETTTVSGDTIHLKPGIGLGYLADVSVTERRAVIGTLFEENGNLATQLDGNILSEDGSLIDKFFTDSNGRFGAFLPVGKFFIATSRGRAEIEIIDIIEADGIFHIGDVELK